MNEIAKNILETVSDFNGEFKGAYNIRVNGMCASRQSTENIKIGQKEGAPGLVVTVAAGTVGETVYVPACVTAGGIDDLVYNDFHIGENADVTIVAGCGVHSDDEADAKHNGIHRFFVGKGAKVLYKEKHIGTGKGRGAKRINPVTDAYLDEGSVLTMDTIQLSGVDSTDRKTTAKLAKNAKIIVRERLLTDGEEYARTDFDVILEGENSGADVVSRSVAKGNSKQEYFSRIVGKCPCTGHTECDAILADNGKVLATPSLVAEHQDAALIHEAAIGKIAGEQIMKLRTLGLTEAEAEETIIKGFLK
ncbi:MAG: SufD family Fe-S cluster assembly protein [Clostridia bacterium]|nr:SufD family Fe-S cluster assembly protein [Clostridia bacterium]